MWLCSALRWGTAWKPIACHLQFHHAVKPGHKCHKINKLIAGKISPGEEQWASYRQESDAKGWSCSSWQQPWIHIIFGSSQRRFHGWCNYRLLDSMLVTLLMSSIEVKITAVQMAHLSDPSKNTYVLCAQFMTAHTYGRKISNTVQTTCSQFSILNQFYYQSTNALSTSEMST